MLYARFSVPTFVPSELLAPSGTGAAPVVAAPAGPRRAPDKWKLSDEKFEGIIHPRDVFLWYPKGEKTSSTVASTIIGLSLIHM